jgi:glycosyltransferase involved in cell wall biosynthesis
MPLQTSNHCSAESALSDALATGDSAESDEIRLSAVWVVSSKDLALTGTLQRYLEALVGLPCQCELVLVDNSAPEEAVAALMPILQRNTLPATIVHLHREFDEASATSAGLRAARGDVIALMPSYLQSDPEALGRMLEKIDNGYDYVGSWRCPRVDSRFARTNSLLFNRITSSVSGIRLHDVNSGLRVMRRCVAEGVPLHGDLYRFLPVLASMKGYRVTETKTRHLEERVAKGDYGLGAYFRRVLDLLALVFLIKFTQKPFRFFGLIGSAVFFLGSGVLAVLGIQRLLGTPLSDRPLLILGVLLIVLGVQLFSLGLLGELIVFARGNKLGQHSVEEVFRNRPSPGPAPQARDELRDRG